MADPHEPKAGNEGDVRKHFVLTAVVDVLLSRRSKGQSFSYVDTHCSLGSFSLSAARRWKRGIGRFYDKHWRLADHPYFEIERRERERGMYLGSWRIVKERVLLHGLIEEPNLFDTCESVAKSLKDEPGFSRSDGFEACLATRNRPDLIPVILPTPTRRPGRRPRSLRESLSN